MKLLAPAILAVLLLVSNAGLAQTEQPTSAVGANQERQTLQEPIPFKKEPQSIGYELGKVLLVVAFLIVIAWIGLFMAKKYMLGLGPSSVKGKRLKQLEALRLTPRMALFLVQADGKTLLLGQHGENLVLLDTLTTEQQQPQQHIN